MTRRDPTAAVNETILVVDGDIVSRHAIADYLRHCGYSVIEAAGTDEAMKALAEPTLGIDVILCDVAAIGVTTGFEFAHFVRDNHPGLEVQLAARSKARRNSPHSSVNWGLISTYPTNARP